MIPDASLIKEIKASKKFCDPCKGGLSSVRTKGAVTAVRCRGCEMIGCIHRMGNIVRSEEANAIHEGTCGSCRVKAS